MTRRAGLLSAALAVLVLAGCGGGAHGPRALGEQTSTSTLTSSSTTTSGLPGTGRPPIVIGDKNYTEQFLLGQLYEQALRAQGYDVSLNPDVAGTALLALQSQRISLYPEYLSTWNTEDATAPAPRHPVNLAAAFAAGERLARRRGLRLLPPTPFADTAGVAVTPAYAAAHHLRTIADLRRVGSQLIFGGAPQFQTDPNGLAVVQSAYGFSPVAFTALEVGAQYPALISGQVQAAQANTTDGQLTAPDFQLLEDPGHVFGYGNVVPVVSAATLAAEGPAFRATIERIDRLLTLPVIRQLNAAVDLESQTPASVAQAFLAAHGLLGPPG